MKTQGHYMYGYKDNLGVLILSQISAILQHRVHDKSLRAASKANGETRCRVLKKSWHSGENAKATLPSGGTIRLCKWCDHLKECLSAYEVFMYSKSFFKQNLFLLLLFPTSSTYPHPSLEFFPAWQIHFKCFHTTCALWPSWNPLVPLE